VQERGKEGKRGDTNGGTAVVGFYQTSDGAAVEFMEHKD